MREVPQPAVVIEGLTCEFPGPWRGVRVRAVDGVSLVIPRGSVFGLLGPNGSGKTTTLQAILGLVAPVAGTVRLLGRPATEREARAKVGYLPDSASFQSFLTGRELVRLHAQLGGVRAASVERCVADVLERVGLTAAADRQVGAYSKGMRQRVGLAQALVHGPELLVLDEPTAGVDPAGCAELLAVVRGLRAEGRTVVLTSHLLGQVEDVCDQIALLHRGRLVASGTVAALVGEADREVVTIDALGADGLADLRAWLQARGRRVHGIAPATERLDRLFLRLTDDGGRTRD